MIEYPINDAGIGLLHDLEDFVGRAYPDPASELGRALRKAGLWRSVVYRGAAIPEHMRELDGSPWTLGYGFTKGVKQGDTMTRPQADRRLAAELKAEYVNPILEACTVEPNENQLAAMACLAWNIGMGWKGAKKPAGAKDGFRQSSVLRAHNRGDFHAAARAFGLWNKANGAVEPGLESRRRREAALYLTPVDDEAHEPMPQAVEPERPMTTSTIATAGTATAAVSTISVVAQVSQEVRTIKDSIGDILPWVILAAAVVAAGLGAFAVYERIKQRRGGWA